MKINAQIKVNENMSPETSEVASGWVEIEDAIKFPVKVRRYVDKKDGKEKMFVTYPQRKSGDEYVGVVYPHDKEVRKEIEEHVMAGVKESLLKGVESPAITDIKVTVLSKDNAVEDTVILRGLATIKIAGITISGITIKEGSRGLFVQMPQHKSGEIYRDTVYGTSKLMMLKIREEVLEVYDKELKKDMNKEVEHLPEKDEKTPEEKVQKEATEEEEKQQDEEKAVEHLAAAAAVEAFMKAYELNDTNGMLDILKQSDLTIEDTEFTNNYNAVAFQSAVLQNGENLISVRFHNAYEPLQVTVPEHPIKQEIIAVVYKNGDVTGIRKLTSLQSKSIKNAAKNYEKILEMWKGITHQDAIKFDAVKQKSLAAPEVPKKSQPRL